MTKNTTITLATMAKMTKNDKCEKKKTPYDKDVIQLLEKSVLPSSMTFEKPLKNIFVKPKHARKSKWGPSDQPTNQPAG